MPKPPPPAPKDDSEDVQAILRTRQERRQRRRVPEVAQAPIQEHPVVEEGRVSAGPVQAEQRPLPPKKDVQGPPRRRLTQQQRGPWAREAESLAGQEAAGGQKGVSETSPSPEKTSALARRLGSEDTSVPEGTALSEKTPSAEKTSVSDRPLAPGKVSGSERRLVSEKASLFEKSPLSDTKLVPKRAAPSEKPQARAPPAGDSPSATTERRARAVPEKTPLSSAEPGAPGPPTVASRLRPITLQVGCASAPPPPHPTHVASCPPTSGQLCPCPLPTCFQPLSEYKDTKAGDSSKGLQLRDRERVLI